MINIGKTYIRHEEGQARLCADVTINGRMNTIWYGVDSEQEEYLVKDCADPFVLVLLPTAMRKGYDIVSESAMSERMHYQLQNYLVPVLASAGDKYYDMKINAPLNTESHENLGAVGTAFSGGVDSFYTIMKHWKDSEYPVTHLAVFNVGVYEGKEYHNTFRKACEPAKDFANQHGLETVFLDSNLYEVLAERFISVNAFRNLSGVLALQGLFSEYLLSSAFDAGEFKIDLESTARYDLLMTNCVSNETVSIYLSGVEAGRLQKLAEIADWSPSHEWLSSCVYHLPGQKNCGHCKKCIWDMTSLYALGKLENYRGIYNIKEFYKRIPQNIGFVMANKEDYFSRAVLELIQEKKIEIPKAAYIFEQQFTRAMNNLKGSLEANED